MDLSEKQKRFVDEYLVDFNATQAAIRAGYSKRSAEVTASRLLRNVNIQKLISKRTKEKEDELIMKQEEVLQRLTSIARGQEQNFSSKVKKKVNKTVKEERETKGKSTPQTEEQLRALELLGKAYALFTDKQQVEHIEPITFVDGIEKGDVEE